MDCLIVFSDVTGAQSWDKLKIKSFHLVQPLGLGGPGFSIERDIFQKWSASRSVKFNFFNEKGYVPPSPHYYALVSYLIHKYLRVLWKIIKKRLQE